MKANDDRRKKIRQIQKAEFQREMRRKKDFTDDRIKLSMGNLQKKQDGRYNEFKKKQAMEKAREDRLGRVHGEGPGGLLSSQEHLVVQNCVLADSTNHRRVVIPSATAYTTARNSALHLLENLRMLQQEEGARRGFQTMMKRKSIADEAARKAEDRRNNIIDHQNDVEHRMMLHEMKKER